VFRPPILRHIALKVNPLRSDSGYPRRAAPPHHLPSLVQLSNTKSGPPAWEAQTLSLLTLGTLAPRFQPAPCFLHSRPGHAAVHTVQRRQFHIPGPGPGLGPVAAPKRSTGCVSWVCLAVFGRVLDVSLARRMEANTREVKLTCCGGMDPYPYISSTLYIGACGWPYGAGAPGCTCPGYIFWAWR